MFKFKINPVRLNLPVILPLWSLEFIGTLALALAGVFRVISVFNNPDPNADPTTAGGADQITATIVVLLAFITIVLQCVEFGFFLAGKLRPKMFLLLEFFKSHLVVPAWAAFVMRIMHVIKGGPLVAVIIGAVIFALISMATFFYSIYALALYRRTPRRRPSSAHSTANLNKLDIPDSPSSVYHNFGKYDMRGSSYGGGRKESTVSPGNGWSRGSALVDETVVKEALKMRSPVQGKHAAPWSVV